MANPQKENGYTAIANEIMEALAGIRISGEARQCLDVIIRKTYGFNKTEDAIALSQFSLLTKMPKVSVCRALLKLAKMNIIINKNVNSNGKTYRFNKDFSTWKPLTKRLMINKKVNRDKQKGKSALTIKRNTKDTITKDTSTKDIATKGRNIVNEIIYLFETINPTINYGNTTTRKATSDLIEKFGYDKVVSMVRFAISVQGKTYAPVITTPFQLKEKLSQLKIYYDKETNKSNKYKATMV